MGRFVTGVAVITAVDAAGQARGVTVNSLASLSLEPPLLLFSLRDGARLLEVIAQAGRFCVNILTGEQRDIARLFASRDVADPFSHLGLVPHLPPDGGPEIPGAGATIQCALSEMVPGGDHKILIGKGLSVRLPEPAAGPLLYFRSAFRTLAPDGE